MPRTVRPPAYRLHKARNYAVVTIDGKNVYLGRFGSPESYEQYARLIAQSRGSQGVERQAAAATLLPPAALSISELVLGYWHFVERYYVKQTKPTDEQAAIRAALRPLRRLFGHTAAVDFGPRSLKLVRDDMMAADLSRSYINDSVGRIRRMFRWAVSEELLPVSVHQALLTVPGLRRGYSHARETEPVRPVPEDVLAATVARLPRVVANMVKFQRLTGCRPSEVCLIRPQDIQREGTVWEYRPGGHKTEHLGRGRVIFLGPKAQDVLEPYLKRDPQMYCFSPSESEQARQAARRATETTRRRASPVRAAKGSRKRAPRPHYDADSYRRAILRACGAAGLPSWSPNQLRHTAATEVRRKFGLEAAQIVLGHAQADITQIYAERDMELGKRVMQDVG